MRIGFKISGLLTIFFLVMSSFAVLATSPNTFYKMQDTQTIVLNPIADSWVDELESTQNYGSDWYLMVGLKDYNIRKRSFLRFDISTLPDNVTIESAELKLNLTTSYSQDVEIITKLIKTSWQENTINWSNQPSVFETPYHTALAGTTLGVSIPITNFVSSWYNKTYSNYGVMIALSNESNVDLVLSFHSRESSVEGALPPQLAITYSPTAVVVPPPDTVPPTIVIDAPSDAQSSSLITITATASDSSGVKYLILYLTIATTKPPPPEELCKKYVTYKVTTLACTYKGTFDPGLYYLYAEAEDQLGDKTKSPSQSFRVAGTTPIVEVSLSPSVPPSGSYLPIEKVTINIKASDPDGITIIELDWVPSDKAEKEFPYFKNKRWSYSGKTSVKIDYIIKVPVQLFSSDKINFTVKVTDRYGYVEQASGIIPIPRRPYQWDWGLSDHNYGNPDLNWSQYEDTFGWKEIAWKMFWGGYAWWFYEFVYEEAAGPGQCTGFAAISQRLYNQKLKVKDLSKTATKVSDLDKKKDKKLHHTLGYLHGMIVSDEFLHNLLDYVNVAILKIPFIPTPTDVMKMVEKDLKKGQHPSLVLISGLEAHTVVADRIVQVSPTEYRIYVYDSNRKTISKNHNVDHSKYENYPYIRIRTDYNEWQFTMAGASKPWNGHNATMLIGKMEFIIYVPYSITSLDDYDLPGVDLLVDFLIGSANGRIEDSEGRRLGYGDDLTFYWEIPEAFPLPVIGQEVSFEDREIYILKPKTYNTILKGTEGGTYDYGIFWGGKYAYHLEAQTTPDTEDKVLYSHAEDIPGSFTFETSDEEKPFSLSIIKVFELFKNERIYEVKTKIFKDSQATLKVSQDFNSLIYENNGPEEIEYTVEFQTTLVPEGYEEEMLPTATKTLTIEPYQTHLLTPKDWLNLDETEIEMKVLGKKTLSDILKENWIYITLVLILLAIFLTFLALRRRPPKKKRPPKIVKLE